MTADSGTHICLRLRFTDAINWLCWVALLSACSSLPEPKALNIMLKAEDVGLQQCMTQALHRRGIWLQSAISQQRYDTLFLSAPQWRKQPRGLDIYGTQTLEELEVTLTARLNQDSAQVLRWSKIHASDWTEDLHWDSEFMRDHGEWLCDRVAHWLILQL